MTTSARTCTGSTQVKITSGAANWSADLDPSLGGSGLHPTPHELLDSALAACTVLTVQLYAKRKNLPVEGIQAHVEREQVGTVYRMRRRLNLTGPLSDEQRRDLLRVANACPIHKALTGTFEVATELVD